MNIRAAFVALTLIVISPTLANSQTTEVAFGGLKHDSSLPVEATADRLEIDQNDGSAVFTGNVVIGQGEMRLSAASVRIIYEDGENDATGKISHMIASGGVTVVNGAEAAEARNAEYFIGESQIIMTGDVILTQGRNAISSEKMVINLGSGTAVLDGRVRTILQTGDDG